MINAVNPFCAFPFFSASYQEPLEIPLFCPTDKFPPFCLKHTGSFGTLTWLAQKVSDGTTVSLPSVTPSKVVNDAGDTYIIYEGGAHGGTLEENTLYRILIRENGTAVYWSHGIIPCSSFDQVTDSSLELIDTDQGIGANEWSVDVGFTDPTGPGKRILYWSDSAGGPWTSFGAATGLLTNNEIPDTPTAVYYLRGVIWLGNSVIETFATGQVTAADPLSYSVLNASGNEYRGLNEQIYFEWENTNDLKAMNLYYQGSFKNRFYCFANYQFIQPVEEENFRTNGQQELSLQSTAVSKLVRVDALKVSEFLFSPLRAAKIHDTVKVVNTIDGASDTIRQHTFDATPNVTDDIFPIMEIGYEKDFAFIAGCQENEVIP